MKKIVLVLISVIIAITSVSCATSVSKDKRVVKAIDILQKHWSEIYATDEAEYNMMHDGYFEIAHTRIINIKDTTEVEEFENIEYIVDFLLYTDFYGSPEYYTFDTTAITFFKDGTYEVERRNPVDLYRTTTFENNYSDFIESIENYGSQYNCIEYLDY